MSDAPRVSIITATYNRSAVLAYTIESVLRQTTSDWEMIVVGDACTDDSAEVVAGYRDPRLRFCNLAQNIGEQSGPNNAGVSLARAPVIAFLNHDDLYFPDHLERSLRELDESGADLIFAAIACAGAASADAIADGRLEFSLLGVPHKDVYAPGVFAPASSWILRRELHEKLGGWRLAGDCRSEPSQDFLRRAWKAGARLRFSPKVTVLAVQSGIRPDSYRGRHDSESRFYAEQMVKDPRFREEILRVAAIKAYRWRARERARRLLDRVCLTFGRDPRSVRMARKFGGADRFLIHLRRQRGLEEKPDSGGA